MGGRTQSLAVHVHSTCLQGSVCVSAPYDRVAGRLVTVQLWLSDHAWHMDHVKLRLNACPHSPSVAPAKNRRICQKKAIILFFGTNIFINSLLELIMVKHFCKNYRSLWCPKCSLHYNSWWKLNFQLFCEFKFAYVLPKNNRVNKKGGAAQSPNAIEWCFNS